ncbi:uncharacterized protein NDAI_0D01320 [Naumovozyma dairenensis CBS 421]|uniref:Flavodoxin-like domain-containing protein n=1 Tax=Naumovozyma dairenensis (strain ATCC 10597 / BCRC 20456 / CBS 421 / NBRC 0211 / NRRL Y-12639) TaxID=1071378 RepID=G0W9I5_NAUDC|nr:hypothetical protein NDAI_0D01320 [Naumovozyma dairenensis CBS 421]CCD24446.1 hypothetical protein NDAI_0D01320 [Naumovozyma dairenensis CBS 421]
MKIAIITYSTYGHITNLAKAVQSGIESMGGHADIFRVEETLTQVVLDKMSAPPKPSDIPVATKDTLIEYDAFLFGIPTRFGNLPAQWCAFWDKTGSIWVKGQLDGKIAGLFVSTASYGGGQEVTIKTCLNYLAHHGIIYVPLGYKNVFGNLSNIDEIHGGSPWGAGTLAGSDGSRTASELELKVAAIQGQTFYGIASKYYGTTGKTSNRDKEKGTMATGTAGTTGATEAAVGAGGRSGDDSIGTKRTTGKQVTGATGTEATTGTAGAKETKTGTTPVRRRRSSIGTAVSSAGYAGAGASIPVAILGEEEKPAGRNIRPSKATKEQEKRKSVFAECCSIM